MLELKTKDIEVLDTSSVDSYGSFIQGVPSALNYYYLDDGRLGNNNINLIPTMQNASVQSFMLTPFLKSEFLDLKEIDYDVERFGTGESISPIPEGDTPKVYKIKECKTSIYSIGKVGKYNKWIKDENFNPGNESKLQQYPFKKLMLLDYMNPPIEIIPYLLAKQSGNEIKIKQSISPNMTYVLYVEGYKGDTEGNIEGSISSCVLDLPCSSSAFSNFISTQKASYKANLLNAEQGRQANSQANILNGWFGGALQGSGVDYNLGQQFSVAPSINQGLTALSGMIPIVGQGLSQGLGALSSPVNARLQHQAGLQQAMNGKFTNIGKEIGTQKASYLNNLNNEYERNRDRVNTEAMLSDLHSTPLSLKNMGGDVTLTKINTEFKIDWITQEPREDIKRNIAYFFHLYGYTLNEIMDYDINSRYYYNFVKYDVVNINSELSSSVVDKIKQIYKNGVTTWHVERDGVTPLDFSKDNIEVKFK